MTGKLSTCSTCKGTIEHTMSGWRHVNYDPSRTHACEPDDSHVSGPDECIDGCDCSDCENERALSEDADAYFDRERF